MFHFPSWSTSINLKFYKQTLWTSQKLFSFSPSTKQFHRNDQKKSSDCFFNREKSFQKFLFVSANCSLYFENIQLTNNPINFILKSCSNSRSQFNYFAMKMLAIFSSSTNEKQFFRIVRANFENVLHLNFFLC